MLPAAHRLRTAADFSDTTRHGAKGARGCIVVYLATTAAPEPARAGLVVGKVVGGSVQRHRAARRIRGVLREVVPALPDGSRLVVRALRGADIDPGLDADLRAAVATAARRAGATAS